MDIDKRTYKASLYLIGMTAVAIAIAAWPADASERHHPQPRPVKVTANPSAKSSSGGNEQSVGGDKYDAFGFGYAAPGVSYGPQTDIFDGVAMESQLDQLPLVGGTHATTKARVTVPYMVGKGSDWLAWALTWDQSSGNEFKNAQARAIVAAFCDKEPGIMDQMNVECR